MTDRATRLKAAAAELGFLACGVCDLSPSAHAAALDAWLAAGHGGSMRYLHRQAAKRKDPARILPGATRAVVVLDNYAPAPVPEAPAVPRARIASYARGEDYHRVTLARVEQLAGWLRDEGAGLARAFVDAGPVPERELAQRAGLGWVGKNTMLLRPGTGSLFFIGAILTDLDVAVDPPFTADHCGSCTRCLEACPTGAFVEPRVLDATRCISYLTIEHKGPIPGAFLPLADGWAFGCDICNEVCPWNERFASPTRRPEFQPRDAPDTTDAGYFERMDAATFEARFADTPLARPGLAGMRRNWAAAFEGSEKGEGRSEK